MSRDRGSSDPIDDRLTSHAKAANLIGLPRRERLATVQNDRRYAVPSFIELALSLATDVQSPSREREDWARLAVEACRHGGSSRVEELEPLAFAHLGSTLRVRDRLKASRRAHVRSAALRYRIRAPLELAKACVLEASFWRAIHHYDHALELGRQHSVSRSNLLEPNS